MGRRNTGKGKEKEKEKDNDPQPVPIHPRVWQNALNYTTNPPPTSPPNIPLPERTPTIGERAARKVTNKKYESAAKEMGMAVVAAGQSDQASTTWTTLPRIDRNEFVDLWMDQVQKELAVEGEGRKKEEKGRQVAGKGKRKVGEGKVGDTR